MNPNPTDNTTPQFGLTPVRFELRNSSALSVAVAGSFNGWSPELGVMSRESTDHWVRTIALKAGAYEYCVVVDGKWMLDPLNQQSVENPFGGRNSIFTVEAGDLAPQLRNAERQVMSGAFEERQTQLRTGAVKACRDFASAKPPIDSTIGRTSLGPRGFKAPR